MSLLCSSDVSNFLAAANNAAALTSLGIGSANTMTIGSLAVGAADVKLERDGAGSLGIRVGTSPQALSVYSTYSSSTVYERMVLKGQTAGAFQIVCQPGSGGGSTRNLEVVMNTTVVATFAGSNFTVLGYVLGTDIAASSAGKVYWASRSQLNSPSNGVIRLADSAGTAFTRLELGTANLGIFRGTGSPEGVVTALVGSLYLRTDGGAGSTLYVKESGTGNTGWIAK